MIKEKIRKLFHRKKTIKIINSATGKEFSNHVEIEIYIDDNKRSE